MTGEATTPQDDDFQDPLENYDPPPFADRVEKALHENTVADIQSTPFAGVPPETTIEAALKHLVGDHIACLLVEEDGNLVGVFSDRDVMNKVALEYDSIKHEPVRTVMTTDPVYVNAEDPAASALCVMAVSGYRHVPVVNVDRKLVGIVTPQRVTAFLHEYMADDA